VGKNQSTDTAGEVDALEWAAALRSERERLAAQVEELTEEHASIVASMDDNLPDDEHDSEGATVGFERARVGALLDHALARLAELDAAALGKRGRQPDCEGCHQPIPAERLNALPGTRLCASCSAESGSVRTHLPGRL
jgi:RNA polymerase-binding transcription factor DksA